MAATFKAVERGYLEREALNQSLGLAGDKFIVEYEQWRLVRLGQQRLADSVQHMSQSRGDGLGYDILSYEQDGRERFRCVAGTIRACGLVQVFAPTCVASSRPDPLFSSSPPPAPPQTRTATH
jgi:hypothetical protein